MAKSLESFIKMKSNLFIIILILTACNTKPQEAIKGEVIDLKNDIGQLVIDLPSEFDSLNTFSSNSSIVYQFLSKSYPPIVDSQAPDNFTGDSLLQFTVSHAKSTEHLGNKQVIEKADLDRMVLEEKHLDPRNSLDIQSLMNINDRIFAVIATRRRIANRGLDHHYISAETIVDSQSVFLHFQCIQPDCKDFVSKLMKSLKTVKIIDAHDR